MRLQFTTKTLLALLTLAAMTLAYYTRKPTEVLFRDLKIDRSTAADTNETVDLPNSIAQWDNRKIRITGFFYPPSIWQQTGIEEFVLVRDNQMSLRPEFDEWIVVKMSDGQTTDFSVRPVTVTGRISVTTRHKTSDGKLRAIYEMKASNVSDAHN